MTNFAHARKNMVDGQIHTSSVILPGVLTAFETIPRELFAPDAYKNMAYNDEDIALGQGRYMLEPAVHAKMVQALEPNEDDVVLDIGGGTGYSAAILSPLVSTVVAVESEQDFIERASRLWDKLVLCNIAAFKGELTEGNAEHGPYDSIIINGAVEQVPVQILDQLAPNGRLVCVVKEAGNVMGEAKIFQKSDDGGVSSYALFDAGTPYLKGFEPQTRFEF